jgi:hypothetical protein
MLMAAAFTQAFIPEERRFETSQLLWNSYLQQNTADT